VVTKGFGRNMAQGRRFKKKGRNLGGSQGLGPMQELEGKNSRVPDHGNLNTIRWGRGEILIPIVQPWANSFQEKRKIKRPKRTGPSRFAKGTEGTKIEPKKSLKRNVKGMSTPAESEEGHKVERKDVKSENLRTPRVWGV